MIVMKFGGSSLRSAAAIRQATTIVRARVEHNPIVVVSALGKVTDLLLAMAKKAASGQPHWTETFNGLREYHRDISANLLLDGYHRALAEFVDGHFDELGVLAESVFATGELSPEAQDEISSFGERLSSRIFTIALQAAGIRSAHLDSRVLICSDGRHTRATPLLTQTYCNIREAVQQLPPGTVPVMGGFIATGPNGRTTTLGRNSSNLTAVLAAAAVGAESVEMWTDVDGVFRRDPNHVLNQDPVPEMSFAEALEIADNGARVLHAGAVQLASEEGIAIFINNSSRPKVRGTCIGGRAVAADQRA